MSPLYEYICEDGHRFEEFKSIEDRHNVVCPMCENPAHIRISLPRKPRMAVPFAVLAHDGTVLHETQTTEKTPPPGYRYENPNLVEV